MRTLRIPIIPLYNRTGERPAQSAADGRAHAADAIAKAKALGIPSNSLPHPICIYADVESSIAYVGAAWYSGWCAALKNAGYRPGVYGDANDEQFVKPYATAFANDINVQEMYYWASHFNLDITEGRETLASAPIPFEALDFPKLPPFLDNPTYRDRFVLWQYMENAYGNLYDYDLALQPALDSAWRP